MNHDSRSEHSTTRDKKPSPEEEALWKSGRYQPPKVEDASVPHAELSIVRAHDLDLQLEEFPEGPYGSIRDEEKLGKVTPWQDGQAAMSSHRDSDPVDSNRKVPMDEPPADAPMGTIEGQN